MRWGDLLSLRFVLAAVNMIHRGDVFTHLALSKRQFYTELIKRCEHIFNKRR